MPNCGISAGIGIICNDLRRTGGLAKNAWIGSITDLRASFNVDSTTDINTIELNTYRTLYRFEGAKFAHSATSNMVKTDSGNVSWTHEVTLKVYNTTTADDQVLQDLAVSDVFVIVQTLNDDFLIYGAGNGLSASAMPMQTGKAAGDDSGTSIVLTGSERTVPKRFSVNGDKTLTLARLNAQSA